LTSSVIFRGVGERDRWIDGQRHFGVQAMTKPPRTNRLDAQYASYMLCGVAELTCDLGLESSILVSTALADCQTIPRITAVMMRPMIGESGVTDSSRYGYQPQI
jgi:hypothetical protein